MPSVFPWRKPIKVDDEFFLTYFENANTGDYMNALEPAKDAKRLVFHKEFPLMQEKLHNVYIVDGVIESFMTWTKEQDADMQYMLDNYSRVPYSADPEFVTVRTDFENRITCWSYDSEKFPKDVWIERDQQWCASLPTRLEAGRDGAGLVCITLDPDYRWKFRRCNLNDRSSISFTKPNDNDFYLLATKNDIVVNEKITVTKHTLKKITSKVIDIMALNGEASIGIFERAELAE